MDNFSFHIQLYIILIKISIYLLKNILRYVKLSIEKLKGETSLWIEKNIITSKQESVLGGGVPSTFISKSFIKNLLNNKDYEITSRNTRDFS